MHSKKEKAIAYLEYVQNWMLKNNPDFKSTLNVVQKNMNNALISGAFKSKKEDSHGIFDN